jgi:hypothetical protein
MLSTGTIENPKNILIVLHGSIGDVTRALPLANLIRRGFPKARLSWAVEPLCFPLVQHHPALDEVILFDRRRWWSAAVPFLRKIRAQRFDLVLDLQRLFKSGVVSWWSGAPHRIGFNRLDAKEFNWIFNNHFIPAAGDGVSKLEHYLRTRNNRQSRRTCEMWSAPTRSCSSAAAGKVNNGFPHRSPTAPGSSTSVMDWISCCWVAKKISR